MSRSLFEQIKRLDKNGNEFWGARDLAKLLNYENFRNFENLIEKAKTACKQAGQNTKYHFVDADEMILIGKGSVRETARKIHDWHMSRYACYLVAQNGDPRKVEIAKAQTYFAIRTRQQEVDELLIEDQSRLLLRDEVRVHNKNLLSTASSAGVRNFANFQDQGYIGLYGGMRQKDVKRKKGLQEKDHLLDNIGGEELGANLFRITQANAKIQREGIVGEGNAGQAHKIVGEKVRGYVKDLGGIMPEDLPKFENLKISRKRVKASVKKMKSRSDKKMLGK